MGAILVFLPGWDEIVRLKDKLEGNPAIGSSRWGGWWLWVWLMYMLWLTHLSTWLAQIVIWWAAGRRERPAARPNCCLPL